MPNANPLGFSAASAGLLKAKPLGFSWASAGLPKENALGFSWASAGLPNEKLLGFSCAGSAGLPNEKLLGCSLLSLAGAASGLPNEKLAASPPNEGVSYGLLNAAADVGGISASALDVLSLVGWENEKPGNGAIGERPVPIACSFCSCGLADDCEPNTAYGIEPELGGLASAPWTVVWGIVKEKVGRSSYGTCEARRAASDDVSLVCFQGGCTIDQVGTPCRYSGSGSLTTVGSGALICTAGTGGADTNGTGAGAVRCGANPPADVGRLGADGDRYSECGDVPLILLLSWWLKARGLADSVGAALNGKPVFVNGAKLFGGMPLGISALGGANTERFGSGAGAPASLDDGFATASLAGSGASKVTLRLSPASFSAVSFGASFSSLSSFGLLASSWASFSFPTPIASGDGRLGLFICQVLGTSSASSSPLSSSVFWRRLERRRSGDDAGAVRSTMSRSETLGGASASRGVVDARLRAASSALARVERGVAARGDRVDCRVWYGFTISGTGAGGSGSDVSRTESMVDAARVGGGASFSGADSAGRLREGSSTCALGALGALGFSKWTGKAALGEASVLRRFGSSGAASALSEREAVMLERSGEYGLVVRGDVPAPK